MEFYYWSVLKVTEMFAELEGVISVIPNHKLQLHTTRSWDFMGFTKGKVGFLQQGNVVVGLLDTVYYFKHTMFIIFHCMNH